MKQFFLFSLLWLTTITNAQTNLVKNGGFETELLNWQGNDVAISPYDKKTGKNSAVINQFTGSEWKAIDQIISIPKNTYAFEISVWVKTESVEEQKEAYKAGAVIAEFTNASDKQINTETIALAKGTTDWTNFKKTIKTPADAKKIRIMLALAQTNGSVYFDDVKVTPLSEEDYLKQNPVAGTPQKPDAVLKTFLNGNFEENLSSWNGSGVIATTDKKEGNAAAELTSDTAEWKAIDQVSDISKGDKTLDISGWLKAKNIKQGKDSWNNGMFIIEFKKDNDQKAAEDQVIGMITGNTDWTLFQKSFAIPEGALKYRIMIALSNCTGTLLADNIEVKTTK
jgi:acetone carboxylase gamma subunit